MVVVVMVAEAATKANADAWANDWHNWNNWSRYDNWCWTMCMYMMNLSHSVHLLHWWRLVNHLLHWWLVKNRIPLWWHLLELTWREALHLLVRIMRELLLLLHLVGLLLIKNWLSVHRLVWILQELLLLVWILWELLLLVRTLKELLLFRI